jgi:hypothetical protein
MLGAICYRAPLRQLQPPLPSVDCRGVSHVPHLELDHVERAELFDERQPCQLGSGNSGETFLGSYRGQLVAVKVAKLEQSAHKVLLIMCLTEIWLART